MPDNSYAARIDADHIVQEVIVIPDCEQDDSEITAYCNEIGLSGDWLDCSILGDRRGKYPALGDFYDAELDEFVAPATPEVEPEPAP